jgi:hypothetical protein
MSTSKIILFIFIALTAALPEDMVVLVIYSAGPLKLYAIDIAYALILLCGVLFFLQGHLRSLPWVGKLFITFLAWITFEILLGYSHYGFRSIGEARYVFAYFGFFIPFLCLDNKNIDEENLKHFLKLIIQVAGWAGIVMFFVEILYGGRFVLTAANKMFITGLEDFRGIRYLGSSQSFNIMMLGIWVFLEQAVKRKWDLKKILFVIACTVIVLITKNRTALIAPCGALLIMFMFRGQLRYILFFVIGILLTFGFLSFVAPTFVSGIISAVSSGFMPATDETGLWRIMVNAAAFEQAMETPWLGQGYGGYFSFFGPDNVLMDFPPHNQYILLFLKTGIVGAGLVIFALAFLIGNAFRISKKAINQSDTEFLSMYFLVYLLSQIIYGYAYGFVQMLGLLIGIFIMFIQTIHFSGPVALHQKQVMQS